LTNLVAPWADVSENDVCMPDGFRDVTEAQLPLALRLLDGHMRSELESWWLAVPAKAATPNWDIACTCRIGGAPGLLLIEAKAHRGELEKEDVGKREPLTANGMLNHQRIEACIQEANAALAAETGRVWQLSRDGHYQMSNRFAWCWKLADLGLPVVLVYLGFTECEDMEGDSDVIASDVDWQELVRKHSSSIAPPDVWDRPWQIQGRPLVALIRSMNLALPPATFD
jgi:hypothetical protein